MLQSGPGPRESPGKAPKRPKNGPENALAAETQKGGPGKAREAPTGRDEGPGGRGGARKSWGPGTSRPNNTIHWADNCSCYCFFSCCVGCFSCCINFCEPRDGPEETRNQGRESAQKQVGPTIPSIWLILDAVIGFLAVLAFRLLHRYCNSGVAKGVENRASWYIEVCSETWPQLLDQSSPLNPPPHDSHITAHTSRLEPGPRTEDLGAGSDQVQFSNLEPTLSVAQPCFNSSIHFSEFQSMFQCVSPFLNVSVL